MCELNSGMKTHHVPNNLTLTQRDEVIQIICAQIMWALARRSVVSIGAS
jgi:hypothetical protein